MARFDYDGETVTLYLTDDDIGLLDSLTEQLTELLSADQPTPAPTASPDDPFVLWEADLIELSEEPEISEDPALQRLFPNPYPHDAQAASDHRRYSEGASRRRKLADLEVLRIGLRRTPVRIPAGEVPAWLKSLNALRLVLASRLGVDDEESMEDLQRLPDDDPRAVLAAVMDWLAYLQGVIIELTTED